MAPPAQVLSSYPVLSKAMSKFFDRPCICAFSTSRLLRAGMASPHGYRRPAGSRAVATRVQRRCEGIRLMSDFLKLASYRHAAYGRSDDISQFEQTDVLSSFPAAGRSTVRKCTSAVLTIFIVRFPRIATLRATTRPRRTFIVRPSTNQNAFHSDKQALVPRAGPGDSWERFHQSYNRRYSTEPGVLAGTTGNVLRADVFIVVSQGTDIFPRLRISMNIANAFGLMTLRTYPRTTLNQQQRLLP